ncbi:fibrocystin-L-like [Dysidea avara]|uniref:fibrocystin-L-like n=1 Tax=Dysidea avara TaxID=196820 RepID=UPI0033327B2E
MYVIIDIPIPRLKNITICGGLELLDALNHTIEVDNILIDGGRLVVGSQTNPFQNVATFILYGTQSSPEYILPPFGPILGAKAIGVFGQLSLHGQERLVIWTHLNQTVFPGSDTIEVVDTTDWNIGEEIVIASTSYEMLHTEKFQILAISGNNITLNGTISYKHLGEETSIDGHTVIQRAEVGLLTRNIKIQSGDFVATDDQAFGCRILVGSYTNAYSVRLVGNAQLDGVEISNCGQEGHSDSFDPRYSFAVLNTRMIAADSEITYIRRSSIHDGYNSGIGVFGSDNVLISDNVIHSTVGPSVILQGSDHTLEKTMATVAIFPGTYRGIDDPQNIEWTPNFELIGTTNLVLIGNAAAGGGKVGFHVDGEPCDSPVVNGTPRWEGNVAHSTLHGVHVVYDDGLPQCLQISHFIIYSCYHYGIFTYSQSGVFMQHNILVDNKAAILINVYSPSALTHQTSTKQVKIVNNVIIGASSYFLTDDDNIIPEVASHPISFSPMVAPGGGHIGLILSSFLSGPGHFSLSSWASVASYPAISGLTTLDGVTFANFGTRGSVCDIAIVSNPNSEDCQHPTYASNTKLFNVDDNCLYYNHMPNLGSVNPSDCVDLDCDAQKHILIKDMDGSLLNSGPDGTIISQAEFEWDGDPRRGLGDYRIPRVLIADPSIGLPIEVDDLFPLKGIVRGGNRSESNCTWMSQWNAYSCSGLDHLMFIFESLDEDTEVRRLSPFALAANGFIDLLNGPQDHGWCGGYTCQERISTFYGIIAPGLNYEIALSSTNPQNMRFHLLYAEESDAIRIAFVYTNPQRLDVYYGDTYVNPTNVEVDSNGELLYNSKDPSLPDDQFLPTLDDPAGSNFYERSDKRLYFILRGNTPITVRTSPVIQLAINLAPVTVDEFFEENLVFNLATLLGIDESRIKVVNVISEASNRKRQTASVSVEIEIGNPPETSINNENDTTNETITTDQNFVEFEILVNATTMIAEAIQTGLLEVLLNVSILSADMQQPVEPPVDPTGGVRATPDTGGPQPGEVENGTLTFSEMQSAEETEDSGSFTLTIPNELQLLSQPVGGIEGLSLTPTPILVVYDNYGEVVTNLGVGDPWVASINLTSTGQNSVQVMPDTEVTFIGGYANLTDISITHPGFGYVLTFTITDPPVGFTVDTAPFDVSERELIISIVQGSQSGSTTIEISPYPIVELLDTGILERVANLGWRGRRWFAKLELKTTSGSSTGLEWTAEFDSTDATASFSDVLISSAGSYVMYFTAFTNPDSDITVTGADYSITITVYSSAKMGFVLDADFDTVVGSDEASFITSVESQLTDILPDVTIYNISIASGSIVVVFFVQSDSEEDVTDAISTFTDTDIEIEYGGQIYVANNKTSQFINPTSESGDDDNDEHRKLIITFTVVGGVILLLFAFLLAFVSYQRYKKVNSRVWRIHVAASNDHHDNTKKYEIQELYWQGASQCYVEENEFVVRPSTVNFNDKAEIEYYNEN